MPSPGKNAYSGPFPHRAFTLVVLLCSRPYLLHLAPFCAKAQLLPPLRQSWDDRLAHSSSHDDAATASPNAAVLSATAAATTVLPATTTTAAAATTPCSILGFTMILAHGSFICPLEVAAILPAIGALWALRHGLLSRMWDKVRGKFFRR